MKISDEDLEMICLAAPGLVGLLAGILIGLLIASGIVMMFAYG